MPTYLLGASPIQGHLAPMLEIGADLVARGDRVVLLTGSRFRARVEAAGVEFRPLGGLADFDDRDVTSYLPDRERYSGIAQAQYDIQTIFIRTLPDQHRALRAAMVEVAPDAILADAAFAGVLPLLREPAESRPPVLGAGVLPLSFSSRDVAPHGMGLHPMRGPFGRLRNGALTLLVSKVLFRQTQTVANEMLAAVGQPPLDFWVMDFAKSFDRFLQLTVPEFEYPRRDLAPSVRFVGPVLPRPETTGAGGLPSWWAEVEARTRPVVHVSQGTIDNDDFSRLILPTIEAARHRDFLLAVATGGPDPSTLAPAGGVPANVRVAEFLPYDRLFPHLAAMVTNGGFGGVQYALAHGVPLVAAGDTEDKPEVNARVAFSGVGIDLRTGTPTAEAVGAALDRVLDDPSFRTASGRVAAAVARSHALDAIAEELAAASAARA